MRNSNFKPIHSPENENDFNLSEYSIGSMNEGDTSFNKELPELNIFLKAKRKFKKQKKDGCCS